MLDINGAATLVPCIGQGAAVTVSANSLEPNSLGGSGQCKSGIIETTARRRGDIGMWEYVVNVLPSLDSQVRGLMANQFL